MLFNSIFFLFVFFPVVTGVYYLLGQRFRWAWLLLASCYFYMGFIPKYILILAFTITIDYFSGIWIEKLHGHKKKYFLILSILSNIGVLFIFKYFNFFNQNLSALARLLHWNYGISSLSLILPIGLSFHTFQSLSYIIEVYRGKQKAERHYGIFALYVMFYPQLVAGPIERPRHLLRQFYEEHKLELRQFMAGMRLIIWGLFKKVVIADRLSGFVNQIFNDAHSYSGPYFLLATFFFAFQIYCDFSGYSDMAKGLAKTLGFDLMVNFDAPYFSKSVQEFWRRWHISLSSWFRDYVYFPLGGSRVRPLRWALNIAVVFLISGLWHGANWTYVLWGLTLGLCLILSVATRKLRDTLWQKSGLSYFKFLRSAVQTILTFMLICGAWILFRSATISDAYYIFKQILLSGYHLTTLMPFIYHYLNSVIVSFAAIIFLLIADYLLSQKKFDQVSVPLQLFAFSMLIIIICLIGRFTNEPFIYFQF